MNRFSAFFLSGIFGVVAFWFSDPIRGETVAAIFQTLVGGKRTIDQEQFLHKALTDINSRRSDLNLSSLKEDPDIAEALSRFGASQTKLASAELEPLFATLQSQFPGAQYLSATMLLDPRDTGLHSGLTKWDDASNPEFESLSTLAFRDGLRQGCIAVLSRRLPEFDLEQANRIGGRFFQICPHCRTAHGVEIDRHSQTLILTCPDCKMPYEVLAADTDGQFRRASDYFEGFKLPNAPVLAEKPSVSRMVSVWAEVLQHCDYEYDRVGLNKGEAWKMPSQTWKDARGDCEDTSLLLADALISAGIDARVAVGWNIHIGQHAWCVARVDGRQYILESTQRLKPGTLPSPIPVANGANEFQPEQTISPGKLHFRKGGAARSGCADYWSPEMWLDVVK
jgi:hypothetical protein